MTGRRGETCARVVLVLFLIVCGLGFLGLSATGLFWPEQMADGGDEPLFVRVPAAIFVALFGLGFLRFAVYALRFRGEDSE